MRERLPWLRSSLSRVMLLVLSVTVISAIALCVLAWQLSVLDRTVARQRDRERLEHAADSGSGALLQRVSETGDRLRSLLDSDPARNLRSLEAPADRCSSCRAILIEPGLVTLFPAGSLRYVPEPPPPAVIDDSVFGGGEALEFTVAIMEQPRGGLSIWRSVRTTQFVRRRSFALPGISRSRRNSAKPSLPGRMSNSSGLSR